MAMLEFYSNLASHVLKKVQIHGVLVDFSAKSINRYYNLESVPMIGFTKTLTTQKSLGFSHTGRASRN